jgi:acyl-CoA thioester hydrolase
MITARGDTEKARYGQAMVTGADTTSAGGAASPAEHPGTDDHAGLDAAGFTHRIHVRYGECDMQGVVFNPNYFAYVDDAMDVWLRVTLGDDYLGHFDYMVKKASIEWFAPARARDVIDLRPSVTRWGRSSFDVRIRLDVGSRSIAQADLVLISVEPGAHEPCAVPDDVRRALAQPPA